MFVGIHTAQGEVSIGKNKSLPEMHLSGVDI